MWHPLNHLTYCCRPSKPPEAYPNSAMQKQLMENRRIHWKIRIPLNNPQALEDRARRHRTPPELLCLSPNASQLLYWHHVDLHNPVYYADSTMYNCK